MWQLQVQALKTWAGENQALVHSETLPPLKEQTNEHLVAFREHDTRWVKVTKPKRFGFVADTEFTLDKLTQKWVGRIYLREALPSEYLSRLLLQNSIFEDDIHFEGILISGETGISIVTSQPDITGAPASLDEIRRTMQFWGFDEVPELCLGYSASLSFYRPVDRIVIFDAHPANAVTSQGTAFPIDFIVQQASESMEMEIKKRL